MLDLGRVGDVAEVDLERARGGRGLDAALPISMLRKQSAAATNHLELLVTNTLINYVSGLTTLPDVPEELVPHYGKTTNIYTAGSNGLESSTRRTFTPCRRPG